MAELYKSFIVEFIQRYNFSINPYILLILISFGLAILWYVVRFFLRLTARIFFLGVIIFVILGVSFFIFVSLF